MGLILLNYHDISKSDFFIGKHYSGKEVVMLRIEEPLSEKPHSFKTLASVQWITDSGRLRKVEGNIIIYFQKNKSVQQLSYGSCIILSRTLEPIRNSGNPGAFDYERYCHFQVFITRFILIAHHSGYSNCGRKNGLKNCSLTVAGKVVDIIRKNIKGEKEAGLAEALLIGYKDDLDKSLVQSYSNTGVVHVVAISGLHLGLIYWLLSLLLKPLDQRKSLRWLQLLLFISGLWLFSLLAGGGPSVIRSAVMFSFIVIGKRISKRQ
jgi:competence protein ComEC